MTSFVFKFRDDLRLPADPDSFSLFDLPNDYVSEAALFFRNGRYADIDKSSELSSRLKKQLITLNQVLIDVKEATGAKPRFLFSDTDYKIINTLWERLNSFEKQTPFVSKEQLKRPSGMPNFFNYFRIDLPDKYDERNLQFMLGEFGQFLPHQATQGNHLLQYAYLKDDPVPLGPPEGLYFSTDALAHGAGGNQFYFDDMGIPADTFPAGIQVNITIIEADGWHVQHPQLSSVDYEFISPDPIATGIHVETIQPGTEKLNHGTNILGILVANPTDTDGANPDLCRGIVPQLSVRLASCLTTGTNIAGNIVHMLRYAEECAVLASVAATGTGETILIELGTGLGGKFPLDVMPAVYELLSIAYRLKITVVAAAGNAGSILNTVPDSQLNSTNARDFRVLAAGVLSSGQFNHSLTHWNAFGAIHDRIAELAEQYGLGINPEFPTVDAFLRHYQETPSRAILVGSVTRVSTRSGVSFSVMDSSSQGNRVKVFAQGKNILTTHPEDEFYWDMGATSGAAAIIAGIVALAQGIAKARGRVITPNTMWTWLKNISQGIEITGLKGSKGVVPLWSHLNTKLTDWLN